MGILLLWSTSARRLLVNLYNLLSVIFWFPSFPLTWHVLVSLQNVTGTVQTLVSLSCFCRNHSMQKAATALDTEHVPLLVTWFDKETGEKRKRNTWMRCICEWRPQDSQLGMLQKCNILCVGGKIAVLMSLSPQGCTDTSPTSCLLLSFTLWGFKKKGLNRRVFYVTSPADPWVSQYKL